MNASIIDKNQTGIASELLVAGELVKRGYDVSITFGTTKSIDLLAYKNNKPIAIQVKGIKTLKSHWNINKSKIKDNVIYILVNLKINVPDSQSEFFILTSNEAKQLFVDTTKSGNVLERAYLSYSKIRGNTLYENNWEKLGN